jgi:hypothetical protein
VCVRSLNTHLPEDLVCRSVTRLSATAAAPGGFDPRSDALGKWYRYTCICGTRPALWQRRGAWHVPAALDVAAMREAAGHFCQGPLDFSSFTNASAKVRGTAKVHGALGAPCTARGIAHRCRAVRRALGGGGALTPWFPLVPGVSCVRRR